MAAATPIPQTRRPWLAALELRVRSHWPLKFAGTTVVTWLFFVGYFALLHHASYPVVLMPLTALDRLVQFESAALFVYLSLWIYVGIGPGLQLTMRELVSYGAWVGGLCLAGLVIFYRWPTAVPPIEIDVSGFAGFRMLQGVDAAGNACPSMHVAVAIFTAIRIEAVLRTVGAAAALRATNLLWFTAIAWSTLAVKQHVVFDVLAGVSIGAVFAAVSMRLTLPESQAGPRSGAAIIDSLPDA